MVNASAGRSGVNVHTGSHVFRDGAVNGIEGVYDSINTVVGQQYTIRFWLATDGGGLSLTQMQVGGNIFPAMPNTLALDPSTDTGVAGDGITSVTRPIVVGNGAAGDAITLYDGNTALGTATVPSSGAQSFTSGPLAQEPHQIGDTARDAAGNVSPASAITLTIDTTLPPVTARLVQSTAMPSSQVSANPAVTGTGETGTTITVTESATTLDRTAPIAPITLALSPASDVGVQGDRVITVNAPVITSTAEPSSTVVLYDGSTAVGPKMVASNGSWSVTSSMLADGPHHVTATARDAARTSRRPPRSYHW